MSARKFLFHGLSDDMEYRIRTIIVAVNVIRVEDGKESVTGVGGRKKLPFKYC
jgi:hypothetical protein